MHKRVRLSYLLKRGSKSLILLFTLSCLTPADRTFREKALMNETDTGFISQEFFQIKVDVPLLEEEKPGKERREACKRRAFVKRDQEAMTILIKTAREKHRPFIGIEKFLSSPRGKVRANQNPSESSRPLGAIPNTTIPNTTNPNATNTNSPNTSTSIFSLFGNPNNPDQNPNEEPKRNISKIYIQSFGWFLQDLVLYKEDYSSKSNCVFLFRNIQKDLYAKVEAIELPSEVYENPN